jgi:hypothetical protein
MSSRCLFLSSAHAASLSGNGANLGDDFRDLVDRVLRHLRHAALSRTRAGRFDRKTSGNREARAPLIPGGDQP